MTQFAGSVSSRRVDHQSVRHSLDTRIVCTTQFVSRRRSYGIAKRYLLSVPLSRRSTGIAAVHVTRRLCKSMSFITPLRRDVFEKIWPSFQIVSIGLYYCRSIFCNAQIDILINGYTRTSCPSPLSPN